MDGTVQSNVNPDVQITSDLNTGYLVDSNGQYVGNGDLGTTAANVQTAVENWFWPGLIILGFGLIMVLRRA